MIIYLELTFLMFLREFVIGMVFIGNFAISSSKKVKKKKKKKKKKRINFGAIVNVKIPMHVF